MDGAADVCRDDLHPVPDQAGRRAGAAHRRVKPTPGSQLALFARYLSRIPTAMGRLELEADHRRHAEVEKAIALKYGVGPMPARFAGWRSR